MTNMTEQYAEDLRYLTEEVGVPEEVARLRLRDEDLWVLGAGERFDEYLPGEEGVRHWGAAVNVAHVIAENISMGPGSIEANPALTQLSWDAASRAKEALRRARERAQR
jgi:hypothetical protein